MLALFITLFTVVSSQSSYPSSVLVPSNSITDVPFLYPGNPPPGISFMSVASDGGFKQTPTIQQALTLTYNGTAFQCSTNGEDFFNVPSLSLLTLGRRVTVVVLSFVLFIALQRAALTSSRQLRYEQAKHVDGLQCDSWILLKCFRSRVMAGSP